MTTDALPLGFALVRVLCTHPDGTTSTSGIFSDRAIAENSAAAFRRGAPENSYDVIEETDILPGLKGSI